jgi:phytoene synthase
MPARPELPATRTLASLYAGNERPVYEALFGIEREISASLASGLDHQVAHTRLSWWAEECARCARGEAQHPLTRSLAAAFASLPGALAGLVGLAESAAWDLAQATFATRRELRGYCERRSAALVEPLIRHGAPQLPAAHARSLGTSLIELELLLDVVPDARAGRLRLPLDELARARAAPENLASPPWPAGLAALVRARHRVLRAELAASVVALAPAAQAPLRGLLVWVALSAWHSVRADRDLPRAAVTRDHRAPLDAWHAWRAARRAQMNRLRLARLR